jgi:hypothetical protein
VSHAVLFRQFPLDHLDALAPAVGRATGLTEYDARSKIRKGWGFLERDTSADRAQHFCATLGDVVFMIDNADLKSSAEPLTMTGFTPAAEGIVPAWQSPQETERFVPWSDIAIVAAGGFSEEIVRRDTGGRKELRTGRMLIGLGIFAVTGLPVGLFGGRKEKKSVKPVKATRLITFGCLITRRGEEFAFSPDQFDFAGLGAGKQLNASANFREFVAELKQRTSARFNIGAQFLLAGKSLTFANYQSLHDFETELLWMLNTEPVTG